MTSYRSDEGIGSGWPFIVFLMCIVAMAGYGGWRCAGMANAPSAEKVYNDTHECDQSFFSYSLQKEVRVMLLQKEALSSGWHIADVQELRKVFENPPKGFFNQTIICSSKEPGEFGLTRIHCARFVNSRAVEFEAIPEQDVTKRPERYYVLAVQDFSSSLAEQVAVK